MRLRHVDEYHPQTLGPHPIISLICPESESSKIWVGTQKEIRRSLVVIMLKNKSPGRDLKNIFLPKKSTIQCPVMVMTTYSAVVQSKKIKTISPSP